MQVKKLKSIGISNIVQSIFWLLAVVASLIIYTKYNPFIIRSELSNTATFLKSNKFICVLLLWLSMLIIFVWSLVCFIQSILRRSNPFGIINCLINTLIFALIIVVVLVFILPLINDIQKILRNKNDNGIIVQCCENISKEIHTTSLITGLGEIVGFIACGFSTMFCFVSAAKSRS